MEQRRFAVLDSWRGVCALLVMAYHLGLAGHFHGWPPVRFGQYGVQFFFVLSGFVIAHSSQAKLAAGGDLGGFMLRRFGRIYPLHLTVLLAMLGLELLKLGVMLGTGLTGGQTPFTEKASVPAFIAGLLLLNGVGLFHDFTWNTPSWSISTEFYAYLLFAGAVVVAGRRYAVLAVAVVALTSAALIWNSLRPDPWSTIEGAGFLECVQQFFLGTLVYRAFRLRPPRTAWLEPIALALVLAVFFGLVPHLLTPWAFAAFVHVFAGERGVLSRAFRIAPLQWLGLVSYSIYLVHFPVITTVSSAFRVIQAKTGVEMFAVRHGDALLLSAGGPWAMDALALGLIALVLLISACTRRWIEVPADAWFRSAARRAPRAAPSAPAA